MKLIPITERPDRHDILYRLLGEREPHQNISHKAMPSWEQHVGFVDSNPYEAWYFVALDDKIAGAAYLTRQNEIGIHLFRAYQGNGIGPKAVAMLMQRHGPRKYLANIAPCNAGSAGMFKSLGFDLIQRTYALELS